jgi:hypothetical protein
MDTQAAADLIAEFATDPTYESFPSLRPMMAVQVKNKLGELTPEQKAAIWALVKPEHQAIFKESLALHDAIDERMYYQERVRDSESLPRSSQVQSSQNESELLNPL